MSKEKTVKMRFSKDMYYTDQNIPLYVAGKIYDVPESMVHRWVKRGGDIVGEETVGKPNVPAPPDETFTFPAEPPKPPTPVEPPKADEKKIDDKKKK